MQLYGGTSGWAYKEWRGGFYPAKAKPEAFLAHYANELNAVEVNNTFYRMPKREVIEGWASQVPHAFRFVLKVSRRITHFSRLRAIDDALTFLLANAAALGDRLGPLLVQLPPDLPKDLQLLRDFLRALPRGYRVALELRHRSWLDDELAALLADERVEGVSRAALCLTSRLPEPRWTAYAEASTWGYLRLHAGPHDEASLQAWCDFLGERRWEEAYAFFKHEEAEGGPLLARRFCELHQLQAASVTR